MSNNSRLLEIGRRILTARKAMGLTQSALAAAVRKELAPGPRGAMAYNAMTVVHIEKGRRKKLTAQEIAALCRALRKPPDYLDINGSRTAIIDPRRIRSAPLIDYDRIGTDLDAAILEADAANRTHAVLSDRPIGDFAAIVGDKLDGPDLRLRPDDYYDQARCPDV